MALPRNRSSNHSLNRTVTRSLVTAGVLGGLAGAFVLGTSYGGTSGAGSGPARTPVGPPDPTPAAYAGSDLTPAADCDELLEWYVERGVDQVGPYGWSHPYAYAWGGDGVAGSDAAASGAGEAARDTAVEAAPAPAPVRSTNGETGTNVQEAGVDEPDVVKTDGRTLFRVESGDLVTYDVTGSEVERLASLDLPRPAGVHTTELLLTGETVVALSHSAGRDDETATVVTVDVSDPAAPEVTHTAEYAADLVTARLHEGVVRLVVEARLPDLDFEEPDDHTTEHEAMEANQELVRDSDVEDWLPTVSIDGGEAVPVLGCDQVAIPDDDAGLGTVAVLGFVPSALEDASATGLAATTDLVYASADQLYLATSPWSGPVTCSDCFEPMPLPQDGGFVPDWFPGGDSRVAVPDAVGPSDGSSHLYAFDLSGDETRFAASGEVDGWIRDRWSVDAADGVLRVVVGATSRTGNYNSIVTFRQEGNDLVESGRLDDLGVDEDVQSVRWFDTLAIVVTFRQVDPLYAIDLTDPDAPRLVGELKIPGFSAYLHPLGQHRLLGLGEGPGEGGAWGAQAGLFNVTDLTDPRRLDVLSYGAGTTALATQDPRQLTWLPDGRTVLTVVTEYGERGQVGYVSVLGIGDGALANRMVEVEHGDEVTAVRLVPLPDGRVVLVTGDDASFFEV